MGELTVLASLARKQLRVEELEAAYDALLGVLAAVVSGETDRRRVLVDLTSRSWVAAPPGQRPTVPITVNGVPVVVVAPDDPPPDPAAD